MTSTDITASLSKALLAEKLDWDTIVKAAFAEETLPARVETPLPKTVALSISARQALADVANHSQDWAMPQTRRALTGEEKAQFLSAMSQVKDAAKALALAEDNLKKAWHNHFDAVAERDEKIGPKTASHPKNGWYCVPDAESGAVAEFDFKITREVSGGGANLTDANLKGLEANGLITHEDYLRFTRPIRVVDEDAVIKAISERGAEFARTVVAHADRTSQTVSINLRPNK